METIKIIVFISALSLFLLPSCKSKDESGGDTKVLNINYNEYRQEIDGFGGSNAWTRVPNYEDDSMKLVKLLFSRTEGMGFTILRNRIPFRERLPGDANPGHNDGFIARKGDYSYDYGENEDGVKTFNFNWNSWDIANTRALIGYIQNLGKDGPEELVIMSTPWSPPNNRVTQWKEDVTGVNERLNYTIDWANPDWWGRLKRDKYNDYADLLADYVKNFEDKMGAPLNILSVQNEPNWKVQYESAYWNGEDIRDFIKIIGERFPMKGVALGKNGLGIMAPEFENFNISYDLMIKPSIDDAESEKLLTHIALHQYNGANDASTRAGSREFPEIIAAGKRFWQTEVSGSGSHLPPGTGIDNAMFYARMIHYDMTLAQVNAFLFWWLWTNDLSDANFPGALVMVDDDIITTSLRLYAMGQYSRFIRPGWFRIDCDTSAGPRVFCSAYRNPKTKEIAIVLLNDKFTPESVSLNLEGAKFHRLDAWRTSAEEKLAPLKKQKTSGKTAKLTLPAYSITTLYGTVTAP